MKKNPRKYSKKRTPFSIKRFSLFLGVVVLLGAYYVIYVLKFKEYDVADSEVTEIMREEYKIELPDGSFMIVDEEVDKESSVDSDSLGSSDPSSTDATNGNGGTEISTGSENSEVASTSIESETRSITGSPKSSNGDISSNSSSSPANSSSSGSRESSNDGSNGSSESSDSTNSESATTHPVSGVTVTNIKNDYQPVMSSIQSQATSKIDALVGRAASEYQTKQSNGESINYAYFYNKYTSAASEIEGRTDKVFYQVISAMENDLVKYSFSKSHAQSFINEYEAIKESQRNTLLNKAMNQ